MIRRRQAALPDDAADVLLPDDDPPDDDPPDDDPPDDDPPDEDDEDELEEESDEDEEADEDESDDDEASLLPDPPSAEDAAAAPDLAPLRESVR